MCNPTMGVEIEPETHVVPVFPDSAPAEKGTGNTAACAPVPDRTRQGAFKTTVSLVLVFVIFVLIFHRITTISHDYSANVHVLRAELFPGHTCDYSERLLVLRVVMDRCLFVPNFGPCPDGAIGWISHDPLDRPEFFMHMLEWYHFDNVTDADSMLIYLSAIEAREHPNCRFVRQNDRLQVLFDEPTRFAKPCPFRGNGANRLA